MGIDAITMRPERAKIWFPTTFSFYEVETPLVRMKTSIHAAAVCVTGCLA